MRSPSRPRTRAAVRVAGRAEVVGPPQLQDEQAELARDIAALMCVGLVVVVDDGANSRYAVADGEEDLQ